MRSNVWVGEELEYLLKKYFSDVKVAMKYQQVALSPFSHAKGAPLIFLSEL